ncbi:catalase [Aliivibrio sp. S4TY2]|uniref:catalase n=1 Tax=unclassified Aliivibrio TaxID=2645654 RepID=UPI00237892D9|nr:MULTISPECIES: catalase [unclassified Aliivibrio]MDD9154991.1 catalase [Aliivibrio sp. S4TY2]MDD9158646.1 catalase [Aliivibrio sp. S4TY1]MDD9162994.1 catalase [Aliivibrio sp. S4MY2]MDD9166645.1 catalase [Aliivibrio sp. S4MY4]MDD9184071.1 catalase [Aliivibrio sp. S4MY3]
MQMSKSFLYITLSLATATSVQADILTRDNGAPIGDNQNSLTAGENGSVLLQDVHLIQKLQRFARERIPERVVHARGTGAHGNFVSSADFSHLTASPPFNKVDKETPVFVRFSTVIHPKGSPETLRDPRGFATKFYTEQGNWDLVGNNLPVFFIRDSMKFPDMVHSLKPSPITNIQDPNRFFDFFSQEPGSTHMLSWVYSNLGTPASYRTMDGFGVHAYKWINQSGEINYVKFHWKSQQGIKSLRSNEVIEIQGKDFNHLTNDLYSQIKQGNYPKWDLFVKVLSPTELNSLDYNGLDATKMWLNVPETKVGTMTLNKIPDNFFLETEQSAFSPANLIPGIEPSEDRLLQGRLFAYSDTQLYRLGSNLFQLPINQPKVAVNNHNQNGFGNTESKNSDINYEPSQYLNLSENPKYKTTQMSLSGVTQQKEITQQRNFYQAGEFYRSLNEQDKMDLIHNLSGDLAQVKDEKIKTTMLSFFYRADKDYGTRLTKAVKGNIKQVIQLASI